VAALGSLMAGIPRVLLSCRSLNPGYFAPPPEWMRELYRALAGSSRVLLSTNSRAGALDYADWLGLEPSTFRVLRNGLDPAALELSSLEARERLRRGLGVPVGTPTLAAVFRLGAEKRPLFFLDVVSRVREHVKDLVVLHAGRGPMQEEFHRAIRDRGLESCVRLLGSRNDIPDILSLADLVLLTSRHEGLPNVLIESQFLGVPVVSSDSGGAREAFRDGETGFLCNRNSVEQHAAACLRLLGDPRLRASMSRAATALAREQFQLEPTVEGLLRALRAS